MDGLQVVRGPSDLPEQVQSPAEGWKIPTQQENDYGNGNGDGNADAYTYAYKGVQPPAPISQPDEDRKTPGLRRSTLILLILLVLVIIVAAVGGGVGGSVAVKKAYERGLAEAQTSQQPSQQPSQPSQSSEPANNATNSANPAATRSRISPPPTEGILELDCPNLNDEKFTLAPKDRAYKFQATCGVDHPSPGFGLDITTIIAYTFQDCLSACAYFNDQSDALNTTCVAVQFNADLVWLPRVGGNCWLKRKLISTLVDQNATTKDLHVTGILEN